MIISSIILNAWFVDAVNGSSNANKILENIIINKMKISKYLWLTNLVILNLILFVGVKINNEFPSNGDKFKPLLEY